MAKPELGLKRQCMSCGAKFYDLNRDPIVCPKCGVVFQAVAPTRVSPPAAAAAPRPQRQEDETEIEPAGGPEVVSLQDVEADEAEKETALEEDIDIGEDVGGEDTFLEEEEEGEDNVSDLIDGDIEDEDEA
ncbi:MAG TPA: TIGR02300 family protein [Beijerinckiaceae bacterium]